MFCHLLLSFLNLQGVGVRTELPRRGLKALTAVEVGENVVAQQLCVPMLQLSDDLRSRSKELHFHHSSVLRKRYSCGRLTAHLQPAVLAPCCCLLLNNGQPKPPHCHRPSMPQLRFHFGRWMSPHRFLAVLVDLWWIHRTAFSFGRWMFQHAFSPIG